ncbi:MAG: hypothetical protein L0G99_02710 [Propionibacteriales bacterium]|nr:hypothetical protein [Propionibacteriales bacterium]
MIRFRSVLHWIARTVLVGAGALAGDVTTRSLAYQALGTFVVAPMLVIGFVTLITGLLLGLGIRWVPGRLHRIRTRIKSPEVYGRAPRLPADRWSVTRSMGHRWVGHKVDGHPDRVLVILAVGMS